MKNLYCIFILVFLFPLNVSEAFGFAPLGSSDNPIYFQEVDNNSYRDEQQNLINRYGSSEFYSCMADIRGCSGDVSDPRNQSNCLAAIEYAFNRGYCGRKDTVPTVRCNDGYTLQNGDCVQNQVNSQYINVCPTGYYVSSGYCEPIPTKNAYVPAETPSNDEVCRGSFGQQSYWSGDLNKKDDLICNCGSGYEFNTEVNQCTQIVEAPKVEDIATYSELPVVTNEIVAPEPTEMSVVKKISDSATELINKETDPNKSCKEKYGVNGKYLSAKDGQIKCGCTENYSLGSDGLCSFTSKSVNSDDQKTRTATSTQTAALALATNENDTVNYVWLFIVISTILIFANSLRHYFASILIVLTGKKTKD